MKHLSVWMTVLLLGSMPLTAAALDYGPDSPLLAGNANAPQLPDAQGRAASLGEMPKSEVAAADAGDGEDAAPAPATTHPRMAPSQHPGPATRNSGSTASNRWRLPVAPAAPQPATATWQSLLPGSIQ
ncbi:MAG: hypothetical protein KGJ94_06805 [Xanthomonadaceae bacterium]|nr:hypothetical protein [Xanthomonadaceae bacterium]